jgi:HAD superfamily hydrolase (TIGR01490 family)
MNEKVTIAAFDFDGTITTKDSLWPFLKYTVPHGKLYLLTALLSPILVLGALHIIPRGKAKEIYVGTLFRGIRYNKFNETGRTFGRSEELEKLVRPETLKLIKQHQEAGHLVTIVSASLEEYLWGWGAKHDIECVLATGLSDGKKGIVNGKFYYPNCKGKEKVRRLKFLIKEENATYLYAYGDSPSDSYMLNLADEGFMWNGNEFLPYAKKGK